MKKSLFLLVAAAMLPFFYACSDSDGTPIPPETEEQPNPEEPTPDPDLDTTGPYKIGDYYKQGKVEGVVYHLRDATGMHGMIVSLQEGNGLQWGVDFTTTEASSEYNGEDNQRIVLSVPDWENLFPVFRWCASFSQEAGDGWYIPAVTELQTLYTNFSGYNNLNRETFNAQLTLHGGAPLASADYWSSSECSHNATSIVNFTAADTFCGIKTTKAKVRAVHVF